MKYIPSRLLPFLSGLFVLSMFIVVPSAYAQVTPQQLNVPQQNISQGSASLNWAGYVAQNQSDNYTSISSSWVVPSVSAATAASADATWVGIGGVSSHDLIQAGTQAIVSAGGAISYQAWVETLPSFSQTVPLMVSAGDSITTTLTEQSADVWMVTIRNNSTGQSYQTTLNYTSSLSSAEWVEEMVSNGPGRAGNNTFRPLDSFGSVSFTGASAVVGGQSETLSQLGAQPLQMINAAGDTLATPSSVGSDGASFSITRTTGNPDTSVGVPTLRRDRWRVINTATSTGASQPTQPVTVSVRHHGRGLQQFVLPGFGCVTVMWR